MALQLISKKRNYILSKDDKPLGLLQFPKWYSHNAVLELNNRKYELNKSGMWSSSYTVRTGGFNTGKVSMNWKGGMSLEIEDHNRKPIKLGIKHKGFLKTKFIITDESKNQIALLSSAKSWMKMKSDFDIEEIAPIQNLDMNLAYLLIVFCIDLYLSNMAAAGAA
ncbi:hypothetical protein [Marinoscillum pacificum]|uniref:hypothetical protein n=1 Tax=Marinoscillum pacificum TaxID=392723 RepID=UPI002157D629|nr:hypothetical protein [Marinoscillum pacificum]